MKTYKIRFVRQIFAAVVETRVQIWQTQIWQISKLDDICEEVIPDQKLEIRDKYIYDQRSFPTKRSKDKSFERYRRSDYEVDFLRYQNNWQWRIQDPEYTHAKFYKDILRFDSNI